MIIKSFILLSILLTIFVAGISFSQTMLSPSMNTTTFAVIGDFGKTSKPAEGYVAEMIKGWNVDFIITTGDNSYSSFKIDDNIGQYYSDYIGNYNGIYGPGSTINRFFPIAGNHDYSDGGGINAYLSYFTLPGSDFTSSSDNERYYDFVWNNIHFFGTNGNPEPDGYNHPSTQSAWLKEQMTNCVQNHLHWRIVYFHYAPFSSEKETSWSRWPYAEWGAHAVLSGHSHTYERIFRNGIVYFVNGLGGNSPYSCDSLLVDGSQGCYDNDNGAQLVIVDETSMTFEFWSINRDIQGIPQSPLLIDTYTIVDGGLPVELTSFTAVLQNSKVFLEWETATEQNNYGFEIERSYEDESKYEFIYFIAGNSNSNSYKYYSYLDYRVAPGKYYYRLKQVDNDGTYEYSSVVTIDYVIAPKSITLEQNYPNPFNPNTIIRFAVEDPTEGYLNVYNAIGIKVAELFRGSIEAGRIYEVEFSASSGNREYLSSGLYLYVLQTLDKLVSKKMMLLK